MNRGAPGLENKGNRRNRIFKEGKNNGWRRRGSRARIGSVKAQTVSIDRGECRMIMPYKDKEERNTGCQLTRTLLSIWLDEDEDEDEDEAFAFFLTLSSCSSFSTLSLSWMCLYTRSCHDICFQLPKRMLVACFSLEICI